MRKEILTTAQTKLLPFIKNFSKNFGLVGGTAIALHIGHRQSIDFDLFSNKQFGNFALQKKIMKNGKKIKHVFIDERDEYTVLIDGVKITFLYYPFKISFADNLDKYIKVADLLTLAALKAYALGRRSKWKDYVDLYFIIKEFYSLGEIVEKAQKIFKENFNEKNFRVQLAYFKDLDHSEKIICQKGFKVREEKIKKELIEMSVQ